MRLRDLNPKLDGSFAKGILRFDCPSGQPHKQRVHIHAAPFGVVDGENTWQATGDCFDNLTLTPSINETDVDPDTGEVVFQCWHGFITNGEIR